MNGVDGVLSCPVKKRAFGQGQKCPRPPLSGQYPHVFVTGTNDRLLNGSPDRTLVHVHRRSEKSAFQPVVQTAAKVGSEPNLTKAAGREDVR
jgi:hypothetical protein